MTGDRLAALAVLLVMIFGLQIVRQPDTASAHNDDCFLDAVWNCSWFDSSQPKDTPHWFYAATTLRNWFSAGVDEHPPTPPGSVVKKCAHVERSNGDRLQVNCGAGFQSDGIPTAFRPGYLFVRHGAPGPRGIRGFGQH